MWYISIIQMIYMCTHLLTIKIPKVNFFQLWKQITYRVVNIFREIILLALYSHSELKGNSAGSWEKKLPLVIQVWTRLGQVYELPWQQHNHDASSPIATALRRPSVWAFSHCQALFESTSTATPQSASCKDTKGHKWLQRLEL